MNIYTVKDGHFVMDKIENTLDAMQKYVSGPIEVINLTEDILLVCNEEGKMRQMTPTAFITRNQCVQDCIVGDFFICRESGENMASIQKEDIKQFRRIVLPIS